MNLPWDDPNHDVLADIRKAYQDGWNKLGMSVPMKPSDPAYWMLSSPHTSTPTVFRKGCYICEDPEFAQMGMPLCKPCQEAGRGDGHSAADNPICDDCGHECHPECGCYPELMNNGNNSNDIWVV